MSGRLQSLCYLLGLPVLLVIAWWAYTSVTDNPYYPTPAVLVSTFTELWFNSSALIEQALPSVIRAAIGVGLVIVVGISLGIVIGMYPWLRRLLEPILEFLRAVPAVAVVPAFMLILGVNSTMQVAVIVFGCLWPVLLNTIEGVRSVNSVLLDTAQTYQMRGLRRIRHVILPHALPQIMAGVRISVALGLILMVISEMFASSSGLGYLIVHYQRTFAIPQMWAGIALLGLIGILATLSLRLVESRLLHWYHGQKEAEHAD